MSYTLFHFFELRMSVYENRVILSDFVSYGQASIVMVYHYFLQFTFYVNYVTFFLCHHHVKCY
jgi:hypothetical protein